MSELLARVRHKQCCGSLLVWLLFFTLTLLNGINFGYALTADIEDKVFHYDLVYLWFPLLFMLFMSALLLVAIIRVWILLSRENIALVNGFYMAGHASLLLIVALTTVIIHVVYFSQGRDDTLAFIFLFVD